MANINEFKNVLLNGGARANQFRVYLQFPAWVTGGIEAAREGQFLCKAASLPQSTIFPTARFISFVLNNAIDFFYPIRITVNDFVNHIIQFCHTTLAPGITQAIHHFIQGEIVFVHFPTPK